MWRRSVSVYRACNRKSEHSIERTDWSFLIITKVSLFWNGFLSLDVKKGEK